MGGRGRRVDGDPRGLVAGRAQDQHGAGRVRVGRGHESVLTGEDGEVCARGGCGGVGCGDAAGAEGDGDAGGCRGLEGGNGAGGIAVPGVRVSCGRSSRTVSRQLSGRCAVVRMVATAGSSAACRCTASASQAGPSSRRRQRHGWTWPLAVMTPPLVTSEPSAPPAGDGPRVRGRPGLPWRPRGWRRGAGGASGGGGCA